MLTYRWRVESLFGSSPKVKKPQQKSGWSESWDVRLLLMEGLIISHEASSRQVRNLVRVEIRDTAALVTPWSPVISAWTSLVS